MTARCASPTGLLPGATLRRSTAALFASLALLVPSLPPATAADFRSEQAATRELIPNYGVIWKGKLTRSGEPRNPQGWEWLRRRGVKSVVSFRENEVTDYARLGFEHSLRLPFKSTASPTDEDAEKLLAFVRDPHNWPVHIHCKEGKGRTGVMAALVRYALDGWSLERALAEARDYHDGEDLPSDQVVWLRRWAAGHEPAAAREHHFPSGRDVVSMNHRRASRPGRQPARSEPP